jgi:hypothetical protein
MISIEKKIRRRSRWPRAKYERPLDQYAQAYNVGVWTICRWIRRGKEAGALPPLSNPSEMSAWRDRWYPHQKVIHRRTLTEYANRYGTTDRSIKRWVEIGKRTKDLPDLENPPRLLAWIRRHRVRVAKPVIRNLEPLSQSEFGLT